MSSPWKPKARFKLFLLLRLLSAENIHRNFTFAWGDTISVDVVFERPLVKLGKARFRKDMRH